LYILIVKFLDSKGYIKLEVMCNVPTLCLRPAVYLRGLLIGPEDGGTKLFWNVRGLIQEY
jgi:hypothetical protein